MEQQRNMVPNGMAAQNMNSMQRPQQGNIAQQIHAQVMNNLRSKASQLPAGWQSTYDLAQRAAKIMQLVSGLRMLDQQVQKCVQTAENFEERTIFESPSREVYIERLQKKMNEIQMKRQQHAQQMQANQMGMPMNNMGMPQNNNMANMNLMQGNGMGGMNLGMNVPNGGMGMLGGQMGGNGGQPNMNFPTQLQQQMRASPLPPQQQLPTPQNSNNNTMDPSALQNPQMNPQASNITQNNPQQQPQSQQQNMNAAAQNQVPSMLETNNVMKVLFAQMSEEDKNKLRTQFLNSLDDQKRMQATAGGHDPVFLALRHRARDLLIKRNQARQMGQVAQQNGGMQMGNNMGMSANNMQQTSTSQAGTSAFDFSSMLNQQNSAIKSQESGEQVVPASNNPNNNPNMGGQMSMGQGVNPQMLGNQNGQAGNAQLQQYLAMQEKQRRERQQQAQQQNQLAQQQAQQALANRQANQLRGQPGGLNPQNALNGGQVNSPAMNMLNRPMVPPGQTTPSTPQPNRPPGMPQTPVNGANQIVQHHQNMLNQNSQQMNQGGQNMAQQQWNRQIPENFPPYLKKKLQEVPEHDLPRLIASIKEKQALGTMPGMPGMPNMGQNMNLGGLQTGAQQQTMPGMPANMGSAVPGFNSQPPPNQQQAQQQAQQQQQQLQNDQPLRMQQTLQNHQRDQVRQRAMDLAPFPKQILANLALAVPDNLTEWLKLKQHVQQNQAILPPDTLRKIHAAQQNWFSHHPEELQKAMADFQRRIQQNALQRGTAAQQLQQQQQQQSQQQQQQQSTPSASRPPSSLAMQNGQAPAAQMVQPNAAAAQQPPNQNMGGLNMGQPGMRLNVPTATPYEVEQYRKNFTEATRNQTDEQVAQQITRRRIMMQQTAPHLRNQMLQQQSQALPNGAQQGNALQQQGNQQQPQRPPQAQPAPNQQANKQAQGQKRPQPSNDDVVEIPNPNAAAIKAPQAASMQTGQLQQQRPGQQSQLRFPTQEELNKMKPEDRMVQIQKMRQLDAIRRAQAIGNDQTAAAAGLQQQTQPQPPALAQPAQQAQMQQPQSQVQQLQQQQQPSVAAANTAKPQATEQERQKFRAIFEEVVRTSGKGPAVHLDAQGKEQAQFMLKRLWSPMSNIDKTFVFAMRSPLFSDERIKQALRYKLTVLQNAADANGTIKDFLSVTPEELKQIEAFGAAYFADLKNLQEAVRQQGQAGGNVAQGQQTQAQPQQPAKLQQAPPPSQMERKQSQQNNNAARKASASSKAPPAPVENKPFDWGSPSPHGVPKYEVQNNLTADKLKMPAQKKRKTTAQSESQGSNTPASVVSTTTSPKLAESKAQSQPTANKVQPQQLQRPVEPQKPPQFACDDPFCDASINGFETAEQLKQHKEAEHLPITEPLSFLLESMGNAFNLDKDGKALPEKKEEKALVRPRAGPAARPVSKKGAQTPSIKQESATPATPSSVGKVGLKPVGIVAGKKGADGKVPESAIEVPEREKTLCEALAEKVGFAMPATEPKNDTTAPRVSTDVAEDSWLDQLPSAFANMEGFVDDFSEVTDWGFDGYRLDPVSSAELTPLSDANSQSSRASDISQSERLRINMQWDPFGNGDTGVPDFLMDKLDLSPISRAAKGDEDVAMAGTDAAAGGENEAQKKKERDQWDWSDDKCDWDTVFGPNAGLGDDDGWNF